MNTAENQNQSKGEKNDNDLDNELLEKRKKYKEEQKIRLNKFTVGAKDQNGFSITNIFARGDEYVIYGIKSNSVVESLKVLIDSEIEEDRKLLNVFDQIRGEYTRVKSILHMSTDQLSLKVRISHIVAHALSSNKTTEANEQFKELYNEIQDKYTKQFEKRMHYLLTVLCCTIIGVIWSLLTIYFDLFSQDNLIRTLIFISTAGSIGGFISVSSRLRSTIFEEGIKLPNILVYGFERFIISVLGSVIIFTAIKCNLIFGFINETPEPKYGYVIFSILAGFSETLVPNLLIRLEKENTD